MLILNKNEFEKTKKIVDELWDLFARDEDAYKILSDKYGLDIKEISRMEDALEAHYEIQYELQSAI